MRIKLKRPAALIALFTLFGAVLCAFGLDWRLIAAAAAVTALILRIIFRGGTLALTVAVVFASIAAFGFSGARLEADRLAEKYDGDEILLEGEVYRPPTQYSSYTEYVLKTDLGLVGLTCYGSTLAEAEVGDEISVYAKLSAPSLPDNDGGFNSRLYSYSRRIYLNAVAQNGLSVEKGHSITPWTLAGKIRNAAVGAGLYHMSGDALGLYGAMVYGDKRYMSAELRRSLREAGLSHIAAVSGMHLSIVVSALMLLILPLFGRRRIGILTAAAAIVAFTLVTGANNSAVRACIMGLIFLLSRLIFREADSLSSLSAAVTLMILFNPMVIYSSGFQLSVLSTLSILLFMPLWEPKLKKAPKPLRVLGEIILVSVAAQIGAMPILLYSFNSLPTYFILSNILVIPAMSLALPLGLLLPLIGGIPAVGVLYGRICSAVFGYIAYAAEKIASLPNSTLSVGAVDICFIFAYSLLAAALLLLFRGRKYSVAAVAAAAVIFIFVGGARTYEAGKTASVSFLNVGRGDCAVFRLPKGKTVLVDGGDSGSDAEDFLEWCGRYRVDIAVLTSKSREHMGGLSYLAENGCIKRILLPEELLGDSDCASLTQAAEESGAAVEYYSGGTELYAFGLTIRRVAYNDGATLIAEYGDKRILFCADSYTPWAEDCTAVKTPNHGYGKYNYENEIAKAAPSFAVVSGYSSVSGGCVATLSQKGIPCYITGARGTVTLDLNEEEITITTTK